MPSVLGGEARREVKCGGRDLGWVVGEVSSRRCEELRRDGGVLQARCQASRVGDAAPGGLAAEEWLVAGKMPNRRRGVTVSVCCRTPCVFGSTPVPRVAALVLRTARRGAGASPYAVELTVLRPCEMRWPRKKLRRVAMSTYRGVGWVASRGWRVSLGSGACFQEAETREFS